MRWSHEHERSQSRAAEGGGGGGGGGGKVKKIGNEQNKEIEEKNIAINLFIYNFKEKSRVLGILFDIFWRVNNIVKNNILQ